MRRFGLIAAFACLAFAAVPACTSIPPPPSVAADATVLDEKGALGVELAYQAFRTAAEVAVDAGLLKGDKAAKVALLDAKAYGAVQLARSAYRAGNASSYTAAATEARTAISQAIALIKGTS